MIRAWLRYLMLFAVGSALYVFYVGYVSYFLFLLILSLPIISLLLFIVGIWKMDVQLYSSSTILYKGTTEKLYLRTRTRSYIPIAKAQATLQIYNHFHQSSHVENVMFTSTYEGNEVAIPFDFSMCGKYTVHVDTMYVYDSLHLFRRKGKVQHEHVVFVLPKPSSMQGKLPNILTPEDGAYDQHSAGNDYSESFDVREYHPGDAIHRIHWKLSAKLDKTMIREASKPCRNLMKVYFDFYGNMQDVDSILSLVYGCSLHLLQDQYAHDIYQYANGTCCKIEHISNKEELLHFLCSLVSTRVEMSAASCIKSDIALTKESILIQKDEIVTFTDSKGGEHNASSK